MSFPTGEQFTLTYESPAGELCAIITEVAAGIRELTIDGIDLVQSFDAEVQPPWGAGITLAPWANRVRDGRWNDTALNAHQLAISEVDLNNAIHGLMCFTPFRLVERTDSAVTLAAQVFPQIGYPFHLEVAVHYELGDDGLSVRYTVKNLTLETNGVAFEPAPITLGAHPYLTIGGVSTDELLITVNADTHLDVDERLIPVGRSAVDATAVDLRPDSPTSHRVGDLALDDAWGDARFQNGITEHTLTAPDGRTVSVWGDHNFDYVQVFITRLFPVRGADAVATAIAIEPMTGPADAFNSGQGLKRLGLDEEWSAQWGIRFAGFASA